jgi:hypothetical protein
MPVAAGGKLLVGLVRVAERQARVDNLVAPPWYQTQLDLVRRQIERQSNALSAEHGETKEVGLERRPSRKRRLPSVRRHADRSIPKSHAECWRSGHRRHTSEM